MSFTSLPHYDLNGTSVPLEGNSLLPYLIPSVSDAASSATLSRWAAALPAFASYSSRSASTSLLQRSSYARSELREWMMVNRPNDSLVRPIADIC